MRRYGQFCPVAKTAEVFCQRWTALIIRDLSWGSTRFSDLKRGVPLMSPTLLSQRLKTLEAEGIVERRGAGRDVTYHLTEAGRDFAPIIEAMGRWGQEWGRRDLEEDEIDLDLLLWGIEARAKPEAFGRQPSVVALDFTDLPTHRRHWWYLNADGLCQFCIDDPGQEPALWLAGSLPDFIRVYRGDIALSAALDGRIEALGSTADLRALPDWLNLGPLSRIAPRKRA